MSYFVKLANTWIITNEGGGPTDDKPDVVLDVPDDSNRVNAFLNIRVADITQVYDEWSAKGAIFLTPPIDREPHIACEGRCFVLGCNQFVTKSMYPADLWNKKPWGLMPSVDDSCL